MAKAHNSIIRESQDSDLVAVRQLIHRTIDACYTGVYPARAVEFFKAFHSDEKIMERRRTGRLLVVEQDGSLIATGTIAGTEIFGVFVSPGFQGRGHGAALMRELENTAQTRGHTVLKLSVSLPSRAFYERLGYEIIQACSLDVGDGQRLDYWEARKSLKV